MINCNLSAIKSNKRKKNSFKSICKHYEPSCEEELALHPKKIDELKRWLRSKMAISRGTKTLLLTGPSGSGKRTAVKVLCADLGIELTEWDWPDEYQLDRFGEQVTRRSSLASFVQFLQETEFCSIQRISLKHRLLLIGQLPSPLLREPKYLHEILASVVPQSRCQIVFVLPNVDSCWELSPVRLFPPSVLDSLSIDHIKFNAISNTLMTGALKRASQFLNILCDAQQLRNIVDSSCGDIRRAMNSLMMLQLQNEKKSPSRKRFRHESQVKQSNPPRSKKQAPMPDLIMHNRLELFHFIGKVMYAKRATEADEKWLRNEAKLHPQAWHKYSCPLPPKDDLNRLIDAAPISAQMMAGYVFEHEPRMAPSIQAISRIASTIAELDVMVGSNFERQSTMEGYMIDATIRASLLHNRRTNPSIGRGRSFYQFDKPKFREIDMRRKETHFQIAEAFSDERCAQMTTLFLPMLSHIHTFPLTRRQLELLDRLQFTSHQKITNPLRQRNSPPKASAAIDPEMVAELALLDDQEAPSPNTSACSFYSISSHHTEYEQQQENDGYCYDIEEDDDEG